MWIFVHTIIPHVTWAIIYYNLFNIGSLKNSLLLKTTWMLRIPFFLDILTHEGVDTTFPRNFGFQLHIDAHHIQQEWNPQLHHCKNFNTQNLYIVNITLSWLRYTVKGGRKKKKSLLKNSWPSRRQQCIFWGNILWLIHLNDMAVYGGLLQFLFIISYMMRMELLCILYSAKRSTLCGHLVCLWSSICT